jgi:DNA-binding LytR/AlgR family response regulator
LNLIGQFNNAIDALREIHHNDSIQLIFLDIRMADLSGVELARIIGQSDKKKNLRVVFTTAYDQYALEGFRVDALDYLLKPFSFVDFSKAATKAYDYFVRNDSKAVTAPEKQYIYLKVEHQLVKVGLDDILYIEGLKDYVKVYLKNTDKPLLTLTSLKRLEEKLPVGSFMRIHRSYIVAKEAIRSATKASVQVGDATLYVSEQFKDVFNEFLGKWLL